MKGRQEGQKREELERGGEAKVLRERQGRKWWSGGQGGRKLAAEPQTAKGLEHGVMRHNRAEPLGQYGEGLGARDRIRIAKGGGERGDAVIARTRNWGARGRDGRGQSTWARARNQTCRPRMGIVCWILGDIGGLGSLLWVTAQV